MDFDDLSHGSDSVDSLLQNLYASYNAPSNAPGNVQQDPPEVVQVDFVNAMDEEEQEHRRQEQERLEREFQHRVDGAHACYRQQKQDHFLTKGLSRHS